MMNTVNVKYVLHSEVMPEDFREDYLEEFGEQLDYNIDDVTKLDFAMINVEEYVGIAEEVIENLELSDTEVEAASEAIVKLRELEKKDVFVNLDI